MSGKYFQIRSKTNSSLVLDIQGNLAYPGCPVVLTSVQPMVNTSSGQLWFYDAMSRSFRSKVSPNLCLETEESGYITLQPYVGNDTQRWKMRGEMITRLSYEDRAMEVKNGAYNPGQRLVEGDSRGDHSQQFIRGYAPAEFFCIKSLANNQVLSIEDNRTDAGACVRLTPQKHTMGMSPAPDSHLWYEDHDGIIRSKFTNMVMEVKTLETVSLQTQNVLHLDKFKYTALTPYGIKPSKKGHVVFSVKAKNDAHISLSLKESDRTTKAYEIVLGSHNNSKTLLRGSLQGEAFENGSPGLLDQHNFRDFWISWKRVDVGTKKLRVGRGSTVGGDEIGHGSFPDHEIQHIGVATGFGSTGEWKFTSAGGRVVMQYFDPKKDSQRWTVQKNTVCHADRLNRVMCLDPQDNSLDVTTFSNQRNQLWDFVRT